MPKLKLSDGHVKIHVLSKVPFKRKAPHRQRPLRAEQREFNIYQHCLNISFFSESDFKCCFLVVMFFIVC